VATKEIRVCDVFGIRKNVQRYHIVIRRIPETALDLLDEAADEHALHPQMVSAQGVRGCAAQAIRVPAV